ncbi:hypothetical protein L207DRAFT_121868 [Hyaloscypha variabilis F]|uniref:Uncharacterized protein n=1 Tax=Hyaloscypha variabilis (strain UAMH 11265 / GT02V1 / F) TaxID=1149755 RepID=A0A2J6R7Q9_HYAVF|nr:hypothetical protein L207DRAFT_121868 [Hyaloscypha variabilis F]
MQLLTSSVNLLTLVRPSIELLPSRALSSLVPSPRTSGCANSSRARFLFNTSNSSLHHAPSIIQQSRKYSMPASFPLLISPGPQVPRDALPLHRSTPKLQYLTTRLPSFSTTSSSTPYLRPGTSPFESSIQLCKDKRKKNERSKSILVASTSCQQD